MSYLFDVIILVAWGWDDHPHNLRVRKWIGSVLATANTRIYTTSITELGFVRVSMQKSIPSITVEEASYTLQNLINALENRHTFLPDDLSSRRDFPAWCKNAKHTTDSHLLALAEKHGLKLATLHTGIPGAFLIP